MRFQTLLYASAFLPTIFSAPSPQPDPVPVSPPNLEKRLMDIKYFHEPGAGESLGHYDIRYFTGFPVSYEEKHDALHHLIRSYLSVFREKNIETWIAHGTLLGWWWNGKIMPWDWDLDVQTSTSTLAWLGENMNMTFHNYTDTAGEPRTYLLDVNPNIVDRLRGQGQNVIDARWIDVRNGLFIDITGLAETEPASQPGIWSCKNYHRYRTRDLYPMRETEFEGVPALVPYAFDRILTEEYTAQALTKTYHEGHRWVPEKKEWVKQAYMTTTQNQNFGHGHRPYVPRGLQAEDQPQPGLGNLAKVL